MKNRIITFILIGFLTAGIGIIQAQQSSETPTPTSSPTTPSPTIIATINPIPQLILPNIKNIDAKDLRQSLSINEIKGRFICKIVGGCPNVENKGEMEILIKAAEVTAVTNNYLTIKIFGIDYNVDVSKAKILRYQWTGAELDDFSVGDIVNIYGFLNQDDLHLIHAQTVRNISLQKHITVFGGVIQNPENNTFLLITEKSGNIKIVVNNDTKIIRVESVACIMIYPPVNCPQSTSTIISFSDLKDGERAIVRGEWDKTNNQSIAEQIIVGNDGRLFFNKKLDLDIENIKPQNGLKEEIKNQIKSLQERIKELREQMRMQLFQ